jgi:curli production assembly/transport component CsgG
MMPFRTLIGVAAALGLSACSTAIPGTDLITAPAELMPITTTGVTLEQIPEPVHKLDVAVYEFADLTGATEPNDEFGTNSRAVTQGGAHLLVDVLSRAGGGNWFNVIERTGLNNLLQERQIIEATAENFNRPNTLPPLRFAGVVIEGAIVGYDSSEKTGGAGARYLGTGLFGEYRQDVVTIALRAVSVSNGRVLTSVTTTKTVYSVVVQGGLFRFVAVDELLEAEWGYSRNEPEIFAVREALELAVLSMIVEGAKAGEWSFSNNTAGAEVIDNYNRGAEMVRLGNTDDQYDTSNAI